VAEDITKTFLKVLRILEPALLAAQATAYGKGDRSSAAFELFRRAAESFWDHVAPDVNQFIEGLPYFCAWVQHEMGSTPMYSISNWKAWARRKTRKVRDQRGHPRMEQYNREELIALRESTKLSKPASARQLGISDDRRYRAEKTGLLSPETARAYTKYAELKGKKKPTAFSA